MGNNQENKLNTPKTDAAKQRQERLAEALRANLKKRKTQTRKRSTVEKRKED